MCRSEDKFKEIGAYAAGKAFKSVFAKKPEVKKVKRQKAGRKNPGIRK
jgi:hypothetical protein